jgi:hypothetical protein
MHIILGNRILRLFDNLAGPSVLLSILVVSGMVRFRLTNCLFWRALCECRFCDFTSSKYCVLVQATG